MTTYNSYEAAKIANPESDIYPHGDRFTTIGSALITGTKCNPDKHCMSMLTFHELDHKLIDGDLYQNEKGRVITVGALGFKAKHCNLLGYYVDPPKTYILRAAALENIPTETPEEKEVLDSIESAGEVEWKNGDECRCSDNIDYTYIGLNPHKPLFSYIVGNGQIIQRLTSKLSKPETPQQREERERLEAAYDLYCEWMVDGNIQSDEVRTIEEFINYKNCLSDWLRIVDKTNYRKQD